MKDEELLIMEGDGQDNQEERKKGIVQTYRI